MYRIHRSHPRSFNRLVDIRCCYYSTVTSARLRLLISAATAEMADLDKLIKESEDALKRLDALQKKRPFMERVKLHFQRNNAHMINILLAGSVLVVAMGRLGQKHEYEVRRWMLDCELWVPTVPGSLRGTVAASQARGRCRLPLLPRLVVTQLPLPAPTSSNVNLC